MAGGLVLLGICTCQPRTHITASFNQLLTPLPCTVQRNGQRARLTSEAGQAVLDALDAAEAALPAQQEVKGLLPFL